MQTQINQIEIKAKIAELRQRFERLSRQCSSYIRISPQTIEAYKAELRQLEAQLN